MRRDLTRCEFRDCKWNSKVLLGFGRIEGHVLFVAYCDPHAALVRRLFKVEAERPVQAVYGHRELVA